MVRGVGRRGRMVVGLSFPERVRIEADDSGFR